MERSAKTRKKLQVREAMAKYAEGKTTSEIGDEMGVTRQTVSKLLNSEESKAILDKADDSITRMITKIIKKSERIIDRGQDSDAIKLMLAFMKTKGLVKDAVEHHHKFPKPTVVKYKDEKMVIGVVPEDDKEDGDA